MIIFRLIEEVCFFPDEFVLSPVQLVPFVVSQAD